MEALYGVGGYYTTMTAWDAAFGGATSADLVANDEVAVLECYNDWPAGLADHLMLDGWVTDATRKIVIKVATGESHTGVVGTGFQVNYHAPTTSQEVIKTGFLHVDLIDLEIVSLRSASQAGVRQETGGNASTYGCIAQIGGSDGHAAFHYIKYSENCIAIVTGSSNPKGFYRASWKALQEAVNCTTGQYGNIYSGGGGAGMIVKNCVSNHRGFEGGNFIAGCTNNAALNGSTVAPPGTNPLLVDINSTDYQDSDNGDYRLSQNSRLTGSGVDLSTDFTTDIGNLDRTLNDSWDIGAHRAVRVVKKALRSSSAWSLDQAAMEALYGVGGYYTSITAWEAWVQTQYLVTNDERQVLECYNDWPAGSYKENVTLSGFVETGTSRNYTTLTTPLSERHDGTLNSGFIINSTGGNGTLLKVYIAYTQLIGMAMKRVGQYDVALAVYSGGEFSLVDQCVLYGGRYGTLVSASGVTIQRTLYLGSWSDPSIRVPNGVNNTVIRCVTIDGGEYGVSLGSNSDYANTGTTIQNVVAYNASIACFGNTTRYNSASGNCASSDTSAGDITRGTGYINNIVAGDFVDPGNDDFRLATGSALLDMAIDLSVEFTTDIVGTVRG